MAADKLLFGAAPSRLPGERGNLGDGRADHGVDVLAAEGPFERIPSMGLRCPFGQQFPEENAWNKFRESEITILYSLLRATESTLKGAAERAVDLDTKRQKKFGKLEEKLRAEVAVLKAALEADSKKKKAELEDPKKTIEQRKASFNTKEAGYVGRIKQQEQIDQLKKWLEGWSLTAGTSKKRRLIVWAYISAMVLFGVFTIVGVIWSYLLLGHILVAMLALTFSVRRAYENSNCGSTYDRQRNHGSGCLRGPRYQAAADNRASNAGLFRCATERRH
jgi:hypothetical protein